MLARIQEDDDDVPWRKNGWWYWSRTGKGRQYEIYLRRRDQARRRRGGAARPERAGRGQALPATRRTARSARTRRCWPTRSTRPARSTTRCACATSSTGSDLPWRVEQTEGAAWANDSRTLYYLTQGRGAPHAPPVAPPARRRWPRRTGARGARRAVLARPRQDARRPLRGGLVGEQGHHRAARASTPTSPRPRRASCCRGAAASRCRWTIAHGRFYLLVNDTGRNFRLVETSAASPSLDDARELIAHRDDVMLEDVDLFAHHMVVQERDRGVQKLRVWELASGRSLAHRRSTSRSTRPAATSTRSSTPTTFRFELHLAGHAALGVRPRHGQRRSAR